MFTESFISSFLFFLSFFLFFGIIEFKSFFSTVSEFLSFIVFKLLDNVFINRISHIDDFITSFMKCFNERTFLNRLNTFSSDIIDLFLVFFHSFSVFFKRDQIFSSFGSFISQEVNKFISISGVFMDT